jgi:hypothetical protein
VIVAENKPAWSDIGFLAANSLGVFPTTLDVNLWTLLNAIGLFADVGLRLDL